MKKAIILAVMIAIHAASYAQTSSDEQTCDTVAIDTIAVDTVAVDTIAATPIAAPDSSFVAMQAKRDFLRKVYDHAVYMQNISARIDLGISGLGHDITLDGKLQMRRNKVIRITITPFGIMEAARLEFTPSYVLLIDRIHKEYVKASYSDVAFLKAEGLTFYTLQSLFWNELFQPGKAKLSDSDLSTFSLSDAAGGNHLVDLLDNRLKFRWTTNSYAYITNTNITYDKGTKNESSVNVAYGNFVTLGMKRFPSREHITFNTKAFSTGTMSLDISMGTISTDSNWEAVTTVSDRYRQVSAEEFFSRLGKM